MGNKIDGQISDIKSEYIYIYTTPALNEIHSSINFTRSFVCVKIKQQKNIQYILEY